MNQTKIKKKSKYIQKVLCLILKALIFNIKICYLGSVFLGHSTDVDLMGKLNEVIRHLDPQKLYEMSVDDQAGNIKFLNEFKLKQEENSFHAIINIWTCILHTLHGMYDWSVANFQCVINFWASFPKSKQPSC